VSNPSSPNYASQRVKQLLNQYALSNDIPAFAEEAEEHGECILAELAIGLGRAESLCFFEGVGLAPAEEVVQLGVVEVVHEEEVQVIHEEETFPFFSTTTFAAAGVEDAQLELGIREGVFLLKTAFLIFFAEGVDVLHVEVLDDIHVELVDAVQLEEVVGTFPFIDFGLDDTTAELFGLILTTCNFSVVLLVQVEVIDSVAEAVQEEDLGFFDAGIWITDLLNGTDTIVIHGTRGAIPTAIPAPLLSNL
jgi:hypothetical protein